MPLSRPGLSVVICACNRAKKLRTAIEHYLRQTLSRDQFEMVLINDGSTDDTGAVMREALKDLNGFYVEHKVNRGLAAAKNSAIGVARGDHIIFVNDDTYPDERFCESMLAFQRANEGKKRVGLSTLPFTPELQGRLFYRAMWEFNMYTPFMGMKEDTPYPFDHFIGTGTCFPREAFYEENIRFDENFTTYGAEDLECGERLSQRGYTVYYNPHAVMVHDHEMTVADYRKRCQHIGVNLLTLCAKHPQHQRHFFQVPRITTEIMTFWANFAEENRAQVAGLTEQIEAIRDQPVDLKTPELQQGMVEAINAIGQAMKLIFDYETRKTFVETLRANPKLEARLRSPETVPFEYLELVSGSGSAQPIPAAVSAAPSVELPRAVVTSPASAATSTTDPLTGLLEEGEQFVFRGEYESARERFQRALGQSPRNTRALNGASVVEIVSKNFSVAEQLISQVLAIDPANEIARTNFEYMRHVLEVQPRG